METLKFNEYNALSQQLKSEGTSINEFVKEVTGEALNEDDQTLDTKTGNWFSKKGRTVNGLTRSAQKAKKIIQTNILAKHYPQILENQKKVLQQAMAMKANGKDNKEIAGALQSNIGTMKKLNDRQLKVIDDGIDKIVANFDRRIKGYIEKKGLTDRKKLFVENYWTLLTIQLQQIAINSMVNKQDSHIQSIVGEDKDLITFGKNYLGIDNSIDTIFGDTKAEEAAAKEKVKAATADHAAPETEAPGGDEETPSEETPSEEPKAEETPSEEPKAEETPAEEPKVEEGKKPKIGDIWRYIGNKDGKRVTKYGKIVRLGGETYKDAKGVEHQIADTSLQMERVEKEGSKWKKKTLEGKGALYTMSTEILKRKGSKLEKEATPEDQFRPEDFKVGTIWDFKNSKGNVKPVEIMEPQKGDDKKGVRVRYKGTKTTGWMVKTIGKLQNKAK